MRKGYWIAHVTITDHQAYTKYADQATEVFKRYGGRILARAGQVAELEGEVRPRNVAIEFTSFEAALECYHSPEYQAARAHRKDAGEIQLMILEGVNESPSDLA